MKTRLKKEDVVAWIRGFEAAREAERDLVRGAAVDPERSVALGLALIEFARQHGGNAFQRERAWDDDVRAVRERWAKLRRAYES